MPWTTSPKSVVRISQSWNLYIRFETIFILNNSEQMCEYSVPLYKCRSLISDYYWLLKYMTLIVIHCYYSSWDCLKLLLVWKLSSPLSFSLNIFQNSTENFSLYQKREKLLVLLNNIMFLEEFYGAEWSQNSSQIHTYIHNWPLQPFS